MTKITFVSFTGEQTTVNAVDGENIMQTAITNDIDGIIGECGGSMMCATCHCYVPEDYADRNDGEEDMLECAASEIKTTSRLSCQVIVKPEMEGMEFMLPEEQL